jgi:hypothetical protein
MLVFFLLILIILIIFSIYNFYYSENFENKKILLIDNLNNKDVDIICSGPTSKNIKIKTNYIICPNYSILNKNINTIKNKNKKIIWIIGNNYRLIDLKNVDNFFILKDCVNNLKIEPEYIFIGYTGEYGQKWKIFTDKLKLKFPNTKIIKNSRLPENLDKNEIRGCSTGTSCIKLALNSNVKKLYISGYMDYLSKGKYKYEDSIIKYYSFNNGKDGKDKGGINMENKDFKHKKNDLEYLKSLDKNKKNKFIPIKNSNLESLLS